MQLLKHISISQIKSSLFAVCAALVAIGTLGTALGCQPKNTTADQTQREIVVANASLEQMDNIESDLRNDGILIRDPQFSSYRISNASEAELIHAKLRLEEYLAHGQTSLRVANRSDVAFGERVTLEKRVMAAQLLLEKIKTRLGAEAGELGRLFWSSWHECNRTQNQNLETHGIHILKYDAETQGRSLRRLNRDQRRSIATRVQRYRECESILQRGHSALYGPQLSQPKETSKNAPSSKLSTTEENALKGLLESLNAE